MKKILIFFILILLSSCYIVLKDNALKLEWDDDNQYYNLNGIEIFNKSNGEIRVFLKITKSQNKEPVWDNGLLINSAQIRAGSSYKYSFSNPTDLVDNYVWIKAENSTTGKIVTGSHVFQVNDGLAVFVFQ